MNAAQQARAAKDALDNWQVYRAVKSHPTNVSEIPLRGTPQCFGLMVNFFIRPNTISLPLIWDLTVGAIDWLRRQKYLRCFEHVGIRVASARETDKEPDPIFGISVPVAGIDSMSLKSPQDLLTEMNQGDFSSYWYRDKTTISAEAVVDS